MADSDSSSLSALSSPPPTEDERPEVVAPVKPPKQTPQKRKKKNGTILSFFKSPSPVRKKRPASPPHEMAAEDNPDIAFIVMFRSRFADAFPPKTPNVGPQDIEKGVADLVPSPQIETLLCSLLALLLNRKKPIEKGHYGRALEEAILTHRSQWPREWNATNPISGGRSFNSMTPTERLTLLKTIILWSLHDSEVVNNMIKDSYKARTSKEKNDINIPLSVQPWGCDGDKRRYWLVEGRDDTPFRVYRESNPKLKTNTWWSVAGSIDDIRALAQKLEEEDGTRDAKLLSEKMRNALPRFEATEAKRKRREYKASRQTKLAQPFIPGYYEGRTRGKRQKYTYSDDEGELSLSDTRGARRSARNSGRETPAAPVGPTVTSHGRQVRPRATGLYGESLLSGQHNEGSPATGDYSRSEASEEPRGRATRGHGRATDDRPKGRKNMETYNSGDEMDDEDEVTSWDGGDDDEEPEQMLLDEDEEASANEMSSDEEPKSLVVRLRIPKGSLQALSNPVPTSQEPNAHSGQEQHDIQKPADAQAAAAPLETDTAPTPMDDVQATQNQAPIVADTQTGSIIKPVDTLPSAKMVQPSSAPTPPYGAPESDTAAGPDSHSRFTTTPLPPPTPAASIIQ